MNQQKNDGREGRGGQPGLPEGEVVVQRQRKHFEEGEGRVLHVNAFSMPDDVQQLEGAEWLALRQQLLGDDSLERRNRATQEENHKPANRSIDLGVIQDLRANISSAHEHRSENDGNEGEIHADRANLPVEDILENACKNGHGAAEHLRVRGEWDGNLI